MVAPRKSGLCYMVVDALSITANSPFSVILLYSQGTNKFPFARQIRGAQLVDSAEFLGGLKGGISRDRQIELGVKWLFYNYWTPSSSSSATRSLFPLRPFVVRSSCHASPPLAPPDFPALVTSSSFRMARRRRGKSFSTTPKWFFPLTRSLSSTPICR